MKRTLLLSLAALASISISSAQSLRTEANEMNAKVCKAFLNKDLDSFVKITRNGTTSDFKYIDMGRTQSFDDMLAQMKQSFAMIKKVNSCVAKTSHVVIHGDTATSLTTHHMVTTIVGPDKKNHKMVMDGTSKDSYRKEDGKWKLAEMNWTNDKMTLDGKPFDPSKMGGGPGQ